MSDHDIGIDEKRVYADRTGTETLLLATDRGVAGVSVSADQVGEFALLTRTAARDVAVESGGRVAVADADDVRVGGATAVEPSGFGAAAAVGFHDDAVLVVGTDGRVAALDGGEWTSRGTVPAARRADGALVATAEGVYRVGRDEATYAGLDDARDVCAGSTGRRDRESANGEGRSVSATGPWAATADGLYRLGNGWLDERDGEAVAVAARADRVAAVVDDALHERGADGWTARDVPLADLAAVAYGADALYVADADGTVAVDAGDGWRTRAIGLPGVRAAAVVAGE